MNHGFLISPLLNTVITFQALPANISWLFVVSFDTCCILLRKGPKGPPRVPQGSPQWSPKGPPRVSWRVPQGSPRVPKGVSTNLFSRTFLEPSSRRRSTRNTAMLPESTAAGRVATFHPREQNPSCHRGDKLHKIILELLEIIAVKAWTFENCWLHVQVKRVKRFVVPITTRNVHPQPKGASRVTPEIEMELHQPGLSSLILGSAKFAVYLPHSHAPFSLSQSVNSWFLLLDSTFFFRKFPSDLPKIVFGSAEGSTILVFLPGIAEISSLWQAGWEPLVVFSSFSNE